jgi:uncharacterized protein (TIGR02284 family)
LNYLVKINNDRIAGYENALESTHDDDIDLKSIFRKMANDSQNNVRELSYLIEKTGGEVATDSTVPGKIYRAWMDVKAAFTSGDRNSLLSSCEFGEDAAQKAYDAALASDAEIDAPSRQLIMQQKTELKSSHNIIKKYRDLNAAVA